MQPPARPKSALTMKDLNLHALSAHVVAWHNRHPLARRITAAQVQSVGYVVLPFLAEPAVSATVTGSTPAAVQAPAAAVADSTGGTSLRERAMARAQSGEVPPGLAPAAAPPVPPPPPLPPSPPSPPSAPSGAALTPAFSEDFIAPLTPSQVARWAAVHGVALAAPRTDAPVRQVMQHGVVDAARLRLLWVLTAQVETGTAARTRVLVGAGDAPGVLGHRLWSRPRIASLLVLAVALLGAAVFLAFAGKPPADTLLPAPEGIASPPASAAVPAAVAAAPPASASEAVRPVDVEPTLGRVTLPAIGARADERRKAAEQPDNQSAEPAPAATSAATAVPSAPAPATPAALPSPPPRAAAAGPAFAVSTRLLRTRTESEQVAAAMRALLVGAATPQMHVEVMPVGDDWRVVGWPYADRALAEKARALLAGRGMKVEVIDF